MPDGAAVGLFRRWVVERIDKAIIVTVFARNRARQLREITADAAQPCEQLWHLAAGSILPLARIEQVRPDFHVLDHVGERFTQRFVVDLKFLIQQRIRQCLALQKQLARRPGIVTKQSIENGHAVSVR